MTSSAVPFFHRCYVLATDGHEVPCAMDAKAFLAAAPRGAYTSARSVHRDRIFELDGHLARLVETARLMGEWNNAAWREGDVRDRMRTTLRVSRDAFLARYADKLDATHEMRHVMLLHRHADTGAPCTHVHTVAFQLHSGEPCSVMVMHAHRENAEAKDSAWVQQRRALEEHMGPHTNEIVMVDKVEGSTGDHVLEGLTSNVFVVERDNGGAGGGGNGYIVRTAPHGVLMGTVRKHVLAVCEETLAREGVRVVLAAPELADAAEEWQEMFITSTSRGVLPVQEATFYAADNATVVQRRTLGTTLGQRIRALVQEHVEAQAVPLD